MLFVLARQFNTRGEKIRFKHVLYHPMGERFIFLAIPVYYNITRVEPGFFLTNFVTHTSGETIFEQHIIIASMDQVERRIFRTALNL